MDTIEKRIRFLYVRAVRPFIQSDLAQQRLKLAWFVWGYYRIFLFNTLSVRDRVSVIWRFLKIDWNIVHAHRPSEISMVCRAIAERKANNEEMVVEAGCYNGGSSAKFSIICSKFGYGLHIYDSFEGVEEMTANEKQASYDFSGKYVASEDLVRDNIRQYGELNVCKFTRGWFSDTLGGKRISTPVRVAYIDCDLAKGTNEVLQSVASELVEDGSIFSQDFHINPVIRLIEDPGTWSELNIVFPSIERLGEKLAVIRFKSGDRIHSLR